MAHLNIEIKARTKDQEKIRKILYSEMADFRGTDHQTDTYFRVNSGRLKLREGTIENNLIHYQRDNIKGPKRAEVTLFRTSSGSSLKDILIRSLGVLIVVDKMREIYFIGNVKFHIDQVKGLGTFVEIEATDAEGTIGKERLYKQCSHYMNLFGISAEDLIPVSYGDLLTETSE